MIRLVHRGKSGQVCSVWAHWHGRSDRSDWWGGGTRLAADLI